MCIVPPKSTHEGLIFHMSGTGASADCGRQSYSVALKYQGWLATIVVLHSTGVIRTFKWTALQ